MSRKWMLCLLVLLIWIATAAAEDLNKNGPVEPDVTEAGQVTNPADEDMAPDAKELSGMSIVGNDEAPKSLYIVPWKGSELGAETDMDMVFNERDVPLDREVFKRKLEFYKVSTQK